MRPTSDPGPDTPAGENDRPAGAAQARDDTSRVAIEVKSLVLQGDLGLARERFAEIVRLEQRRASRIAFHFLRDGAEADEAVQDAFLKVFSHIASFREEMPFGVWFAKILVNGCLDRQKARHRRNRWLAFPAAEPDGDPRSGLEAVPGSAPTPEDLLISRERRQTLARAIGSLRGRQRTVFVMCHIDGRSPREVGTLTGMSESTVRVHLFRAVHRLRAHLEESRETE